MSSRPPSPLSLISQGVVSDAVQRKEHDLVGRDMERLRGSVQTVCRSALPLGKIMDYIQEDMDSMQAELLAWRRENQQHAQALQQEQRSGGSGVALRRGGSGVTHSQPDDDVTCDLS